MRAVELFLVVLLAGVCATAQDVHYANLNPAAVTMPAAIEPLSLPATPQPQKKKVVDKKFLLIVGVLATAEALRITTTTLALDREAAEGAPWVSVPPPHGTLIAKNGFIFASELFVAYAMKKPHSWIPGDKVIRKLWWAYPAAAATVHFKSAAHNVGLKSAEGCDSTAECEMQ
jgi:hypothetical protein